MACVGGCVSCRQQVSETLGRGLIEWGEPPCVVHHYFGVTPEAGTLVVSVTTPAHAAVTTMAR